MSVRVGSPPAGERQRRSVFVTRSQFVDPEKQKVHDFWNAASCGEELYLTGSDRTAYEEQARQRYLLEPYIPEFAQFDDAAGRRVLEIGLGLGADHQRFAEAGGEIFGVDLTERAVQHTARRMAAYGFPSRLHVGDAEHLAFPNAYFDRVYSWGVLHHTPDTAGAVLEVKRVLKPGGRARVMIYHRLSLVAIMLWLRYALLRLRPWTSFDEILARYLESPGTKGYSTAGARRLFAGWSEVNISIVLSHGDLLASAAGQRHSGPLLSLARRLWPRPLLRRVAPQLGLFMLIDARK